MDKMLDRDLVKHSLALLKEDPLDESLAKAVLCEIVGIDSEPQNTNLFEFMKYQIIDMKTQLDQMMEFLKKTSDFKVIKSTKLAIVLQQYDYLLQDFSVVFDESGNNPVIYYQDKCDQETIYEAYDFLNLELSKLIGFREIDYQTISRAIMKAFNFIKYSEKSQQLNLGNALVLEKAYALLASRKNRQYITIPDLKKLITSLDLTTKQIETVLLDSNWEIVYSGKCKTKFFRPANEN